MSLDNPLLKHINEYLKILKELSNLLDNDSLQQNTYQCIRQESYAKAFSDLTKLDIDALLITGQAESLSKKVFLNILKQIEVINKLIDDKDELITHFDFIHLYDKVLLPKMFENKILIARQDLKEIQEKEKPIWVSQCEFDEDKKYWEKELYRVLAERDTYTQDNVHLIQNYYHKIRDYLLIVKEDIYVYYPEDRLRLESDLFEIKDVLKLYNSALELKCFKEDDLAFEDFYLIFNLREPKARFDSTFKYITKFAQPPLYEMMKDIEKDVRDKVIDFIVLKLKLKSALTISKRFYKPSEEI